MSRLRFKVQSSKFRFVLLLTILLVSIPYAALKYPFLYAQVAGNNTLGSEGIPSSFEPGQSTPILLPLELALRWGNSDVFRDQNNYLATDSQNNVDDKTRNTMLSVAEGDKQSDHPVSRPPMIASEELEPAVQQVRTRLADLGYVVFAVEQQSDTLGVEMKGVSSQVDVRLGQQVLDGWTTLWAIYPSDGKTLATGLRYGKFVIVFWTSVIDFNLVINGEITGDEFWNRRVIIATYDRESGKRINTGDFITKSFIK